MNRLAASFAIACGAAWFATNANAETVEQLQRELAAKKAYIAKLEQRLRALEKRPPAARPTLVTAPVVAAPPPGRVAVAAPPPSPEDDEMERALERTLVREGALVLPPWTYEVTPQFSYGHWDSVQDPFIRNSYSAGLSFRMGLPWQSQVTVSLPYVWNEGRDPFPSSSGLGDAGVLLSKELLIDDGGWVPNLVGSVGWTSPTSRGSAFSPIPYVSGFQGGLTASKRLDPLVVFLGASYFSSASRDIALTQSNPSDVAGLRVGGSLAISPSTSVTTGFNVAYLTNPHFTDFVVPNSDRVLSTVDVGFSTIVWARTLLNVTAQFGITGHVPDFRVITSLPIRF
jgi:uncharacterized coiled-coil protein SlyX